MLSKKKLVVVLVGATVLALLFLGGILSVLPVDTTTHSQYNGGWKGAGSYEPTHREDGQDGFGEIMKWGTIATAVTPTGDSETVAVSFRLVQKDLTACYNIAAMYKFKLDDKPMKNEQLNGLTLLQGPNMWNMEGSILTQGTEWFGPGAGGHRDLAPLTFKLRGQFAYGQVLRVELWSQCGGAGGSPPNPFYLVAYDQAQLVGCGTDGSFCGVSWGKELYAVGETACVTYKVPFVSTETTGVKWYLTIKHDGTGATIVDTWALPDTGGQKCFTVTAAMFQTTEGACRNTITATLHTDFYPVDWKKTATIDFASKGPKLDGPKTDKAEYTEGDVIHITWTATPNAETKLPIVRTEISIGANSPVTVELPANATSYDYRTEVINSTRTLHITVTIQDKGCRPALHNIDVLVHAKQWSGAPFGLDLGWLVPLIVGIVLLLVAAVVRGIPPWLRWILGLVGLALLLLAILGAVS